MTAKALPQRRFGTSRARSLSLRARWRVMQFEFRRVGDWIDRASGVGSACPLGESDIVCAVNATRAGLDDDSDWDDPGSSLLRGLRD